MYPYLELSVASWCHGSRSGVNLFDLGAMSNRIWYSGVDSLMFCTFNEGLKEVRVILMSKSTTLDFLSVRYIDRDLDIHSAGRLDPELVSRNRNRNRNI